MTTPRHTELFVEAAKRFKSFIPSIRFWDTKTRETYYLLKKDYEKKRKLHAIASGLGKFPESHWPR
jgi:hypothetical protein